MHGRYLIQISYPRTRTLRTFLAPDQHRHSHADPDQPPNAVTGELEAAHILPFALGSFDTRSGPSVNRNATIWVNLRHYFPVLRQMDFTSEHINEEKNVIMLDHNVRVAFGKFNLIFEYPETVETNPLSGVVGARLSMLHKSAH